MKNELHKIKRYTLGAQRIEVRRMKGDSANSGYLGRMDNNTGVLRVWEKSNGEIIPDDAIAQTICHEVVHSIFTSIGRNDLSSDETLTHSFAVMMHQFMETAK